MALAARHWLCFLRSKTSRARQNKLQIPKDHQMTQRRQTHYAVWFADCVLQQSIKGCLGYSSRLYDFLKGNILTRIFRVQKSRCLLFTLTSSLPQVTPLCSGSTQPEPFWRHNNGITRTGTASPPSGSH